MNIPRVYTIYIYTFIYKLVLTIELCSSKLIYNTITL